jgi:FKBP-type peptidyl-prolyl cis-trans isomerase FkpA
MLKHAALFGSFPIALAAVLAMAGCTSDSATPEPSPLPATPEPVVSEAPTIAEPTKVGESVKQPSGLVYETLKEGTGPQAKFHDIVVIHYIAALDGGKDFDSTRERNHPATFELGDTRFIQGWNEGIAGMKTGERRKLTVPAALGYGALGRLPVIPPNSKLALDIELLAIGEPPPDLKAQSLGAKFMIPSKAQMDSGENEWVEGPATATENKK